MAHVAIGYGTPEKGEDLAGDTGNFEAFWITGAVLGTTEDIPAMRAGKLWLQENYRLGFVVQVLPEDQNTTQLACEQRAVAILGEVFEAVALDPALGLTGTYAVLVITPRGWSVNTEPLSPNLAPGCRFEGELDVLCRFN